MSIHDFNVSQQNCDRGICFAYSEKHGASQLLTKHIGELDRVILKGQTKDAKKKATKNKFSSVLERFQNQESYRTSHVVHGWTEDFRRCIRKTNHMLLLELNKRYAKNNARQRRFQQFERIEEPSADHTKSGLRSTVRFCCDEFWTGSDRGKRSVHSEHRVFC